jgi:hypothetical protein
MNGLLWELRVRRYMQAVLAAEVNGALHHSHVISLIALLLRANHVPLYPKLHTPVGWTANLARIGCSCGCS